MDIFVYKGLYTKCQSCAGNRTQFEFEHLFLKQSKLYEVKKAHPWWDSIPRPLDYMPSEANAETQECETLQIKAW